MRDGERQTLDTGLLPAARDWWKPLALAVVIAFLHWRTLMRLGISWRYDAGYNYGFLIIPISLYLVWRQRERLLRAEARPTVWGWPLIVFALYLQLTGVTNQIGYFQGVSFIVLIAGVVLALGGWRMFKLTAFPICYLLFMVPPPPALHGGAAFQLQLIATRASATLLELMGVPCLATGNIIQLESMTLQVVEACSGIRSLVGLLSMGILLGYLLTPRLWMRLVLASSTVVIAVVANILRITGTGLICQYWDARWADGFYHGFSAWVVFVFALGLLLFEAWLLELVFGVPREAPPHEK